MTYWRLFTEHVLKEGFSFPDYSERHRICFIVTCMCFRFLLKGLLMVGMLVSSLPSVGVPAPPREQPFSLPRDPR